MNNRTFLEMTDWAEKTFPQRTNHSILTHIRRELVEIELDPDDIEEWADVLLLFMHGLRERNIAWSLLEEYVYSKFAKNKERKWKAPDEHGVVEHEKGEE